MLADLNPPQLEAVNTTSGPLLVLAGAGTGKTRVLTSRIIHIVNSGLASPYQILAVTFTNKAAAEMKKRIGEVIGEQVNSLWVGTFHSIAARILRRHPEIVGLRNDFTIIDTDDQTRLLKQILTDFNIDAKQFPAKNYLAKISRFKDQVLTPKNINVGNEDMNLPRLRDVYETYQSRLKSMNAADFGDLLLYNLEIFASAPETLGYYQDKFRYILVDEYQDTNNAQYRWLLYLAATHKNICCVGDDDQSIYSWRGANIANILRFEKDFKDAKVVRLEQNYRSTANILKAADAVISNNKERHGKTLWTDIGIGEKVKVFSFLDDRSEAATITGTIKNAVEKKKFSADQIAILVRAGYQTRSFEEAFIAASLPYKIIGGMKFYERMEIRDAIAYLRICANPSDDLALSRIINVPKRGVGDTAVSSLYEKSKQDGTPLFATLKKSLAENLIKGKAKESLKILIEQIEKYNSQIGSVNLSELAKSLLNEVGYIQMWKAENSLEAQGRIENIEEFIISLADFSSMIEFLEYVSLVEARDEKNLQNAVSVMTVHAAKGLEFDLVFVPGLEDGVFPSARSVEERGGLEEERRLMYVAITRARKELVLTFAKSRFVFGDYQAQLPSRFLQELPESDVHFEEINFGGEFLHSQKNYSQNYENSSWKNNPPSPKGFGGQARFDKGFGAANSYQNKSFTKPAISGSKMEDGISGKRIFHQKFGYGKVVNVDGNKLEIEFEKTGRKTVMKDFVSAA
jgi:DNA helicase-2/ATP-dependent DNA helicase PcrA